MKTENVETNPSAGALRAAVAILHPGTSVSASSEAVKAAEVIDRETGAPDVLNALKSLLHRIEVGANSGEDFETFFKQSVYIHKARAAISKAEGRG
jgi:hypothetical protein